MATVSLTGLDGCCCGCADENFNDGNPCSDTSTCTFYEIGDLASFDTCDQCDGSAMYECVDIVCTGSCHYIFEFRYCL